MKGTHDRRDFMKALLAGALAPVEPRARAQSPKAPERNWVGIQIGPHGLYDEMRFPGLQAFGRAVRDSRA